MKTARTLFYLLLATNLVLGIASLLPFAGVRLPWATAGESERLSHQLTPEKIRIESPAAVEAPATESAPAVEASAPPAEAAPLPQAAAAPSTTSAPAKASPAAASIATAKCSAVSNLSQAETQDLAARAAKLEGLKVHVSGVSPTSFWVIIPPNGGKDGAKKRIELLGKAGFDDRYVVHDSGPNLYAVSIGKFHNEEAAKRLVESLRAKNFKTAIITPLDESGRDARADVSGRADMLDKLIRDFLADHKEAQRDDCQ
jgi:cell division septation protein DedD